MTIRVPRLSVLLVLLAACAGTPAPATPPSRPPVERIVTGTAPALDDDGRLHFFRSYFALEQVGREATHFTAWWNDVEPSHCEATVLDGEVALTGCMFGGMSVPPKSIPAVPDERKDEEALVERAVKQKNPNASGIRVGYAGTYRELVVSEMIVVTSAQIMSAPVGWHGRLRLRANGALTRIEGVAAGMSQSGYGMIDIPADAARIDLRLPPAEDGQRLLTSGDLSKVEHGPLLMERALAVARDVAAGREVPSFGELLASPIDAAVPSSYDQPVALSVTIYARHKDFQKQEHRELVLRLRPREAAEKGKALASTETDVAGVHVKVSATMSAFTPSKTAMRAALPYEGRDMEAALTVHVEDGRGNVFDRTYPARGKVVGDPPALATPAGLELPGTSSPSKEADALRFTWPGHAQATQLDFYVSPTLYAAPIR